MVSRRSHSGSLGTSTMGRLTLEAQLPFTIVLLQEVHRNEELERVQALHAEPATRKHLTQLLLMRILSAEQLKHEPIPPPLQVTQSIEQGTAG